MYLQMMVVNSELFVLGEKKDKKEDDVDMSDGKQELLREKWKNDCVNWNEHLCWIFFLMLYNYT